MRALDYLADNLDGGWAGAWAQLGPGDTVGGGRGGHSLPPPLSTLPILTYLRCSWPTGGVPLAQRRGGGHLACYRATPYFTDLNTASTNPFFLSLVPALWLLAATR